MEWTIFPVLLCGLSYFFKIYEQPKKDTEESLKRLSARGIKFSIESLQHMNNIFHCAMCISIICFWLPTNRPDNIIFSALQWFSISLSAIIHQILNSFRHNKNYRNRETSSILVVVMAFLSAFGLLILVFQITLDKVGKSTFGLYVILYAFCVLWEWVLVIFFWFNDWHFEKNETELTEIESE